MKKLYPVLVAGVVGAALVLGGCAGSSVTGELPAVAEITPAPDRSDTAESETVDTATPEEIETAKTDPKAEPDSFCGLSTGNSPYDIFFSYLVSQVEDGKYRDFEGRISDVIFQYKDIDLDADGTVDEIIRKKESDDQGEGFCYEIALSSGPATRTKVFSAMPNEGEIFEFKDLDKNGISEILVTHYTDGTGGITAWDIYLYTVADDGQWKCITIKDDRIRLAAVTDEFGIDMDSSEGAEDEPFIRSAELDEDKVLLLLDHGMKSGPALYTDLDAVSLKLENGELVPDGHSTDIVDRYWPYIASVADSPWGDSIMIEELEPCDSEKDVIRLKNLFNAYCLAQFNIDSILMEKISDGTISDDIRYRTEESYGFFEDFSDLKMYLAKGYREDSYVAVVTYQVLLTGQNATYPEVGILYICRNINGGLYINWSPLSGREADFMNKLKGDEMVDSVKVPEKLAEKYTDIGMVEFNQTVAVHPGLMEAISSMDEILEERIMQRKTSH